MSETSNDVTVQRSAENFTVKNGTDDLKGSFGLIKASIKEATPICVGGGSMVIRLQDPNAPPMTRRYLPHWA